jgi:hypothetical protein
MDQLERLKNLVSRITYKPGWTFSLTWFGDERCWLQIATHVVDVESGLPGMPLTFTEPIDLSIMETLNDETIVRGVLGNALQKFEAHEFDEWFKFKGRCVRDPHPELKPKFMPPLTFTEPRLFNLFSFSEGYSPFRDPVKPPAMFGGMPIEDVYAPFREAELYKPREISSELRFKPLDEMRDKAIAETLARLLRPARPLSLLPVDGEQGSGFRPLLVSGCDTCSVDRLAAVLAEPRARNDVLAALGAVPLSVLGVAPEGVAPEALGRFVVHGSVGHGHGDALLHQLRALGVNDLVILPQLCASCVKFFIGRNSVRTCEHAEPFEVRRELAACRARRVGANNVIDDADHLALLVSELDDPILRGVHHGSEVVAAVGVVDLGKNQRWDRQRLRVKFPFRTRWNGIALARSDPIGELAVRNVEDVDQGQLDRL